MRQIWKSVAVVALAVLLTDLGVAAQDTAKKKKPGFERAVAKSFALPATITLTDEQKSKLGEVKTEFEPKVKEVVAKQNAILTPEQKKTKAATTKAARAAGKKGKELQAEVAAAINLTDEQKQQQEAVGKELKELNGKIREKISSFLTEEQKAQLKVKKKKKAKNA